MEKYLQFSCMTILGEVAVTKIIEEAVRESDPETLPDVASTDSHHSIFHPNLEKPTII